MKLDNQSKLFLQEVRHIPELKKSLIFVSKLDGEAIKILSEGNQEKICKGSMVMNDRKC